SRDNRSAPVFPNSFCSLGHAQISFLTKAIPPCQERATGESRENCLNHRPRQHSFRLGRGLAPLFFEHARRNRSHQWDSSRNPLPEISAVHQKHGTSEYSFLIEEIPSLYKVLDGRPATRVFEPAIRAYG